MKFFASIIRLLNSSRQLFSSVTAALRRGSPLKSRLFLRTEIYRTRLVMCLSQTPITGNRLQAREARLPSKLNGKEKVPGTSPTIIAHESFYAKIRRMASLSHTPKEHFD